MVWMGSAGKGVLMAMEPADPIKIVNQFIRILEALGIRYMIGGSLASSLYGVPRATQDVDVVVEL